MNLPNQRKNKLKIFGIVLAIALVFGAMFILASRGNAGTLLTSTQAEEIIYSGGYMQEVTKEGIVVTEKKETGYVTDMYASGGVCYIRVAESKLGNKPFPKFADYYFTYDNSNNKTLDQFYNFNYLVQYKSEHPDATVCEVDGYERNIEGLELAQKINITRKVQTESFFSMIMPYIIMLVILGLSMFILVKILAGKSGGANTFTRNRARLVEKCTVRFSDIAGAEEEKEETREIVEFLKDPSKFEALGARIPKGILLVGNPGTGKTLLAKAVAGESRVPFFSISGSDFVELYVGVGASRVRDLFETAKRNAPCIVFIDEIDAVGRQRGAGMGGGNDEREQTLNQLLVEMDGFESNSGIIILAATNRADVLDPALLRPGRFDRQIYVNVPDVKGREGILKIHAEHKPIEEGVNFKDIARLTSGFTGADIENFLNEAAILAARDNRLTITMEDITEGINKVTMGPQKKSRLVTENDRKLTAYHESGHAIIAKFMDCGDTVHEVSIIPRGMAGGYTNIRPSDDDSHYSLGKLNNRICMIMGGRIAEEIMIGDISAGASSDIQRATEIARKMVVEWGMSEKLGFMSFGKNNEVFIGRDYQVQNQYSEYTAKLIDEEIKRILDENYKKAKALLVTKKALLQEMSDLLLQEETIYSEEVDDLIAGKSSEEIVNRLHEKEQKRKEKQENIRKEQELAKQAKALEFKLKTAKALRESGVMGEEEYNYLKEKFAEEMKIKETSVSKQPEAETSVESNTETTDLKPTAKAKVDNLKPVSPKSSSTEKAPAKKTTRKAQSDEPKSAEKKAKTPKTKQETKSHKDK